MVYDRESNVSLTNKSVNCLKEKIWSADEKDFGALFGNDYDDARKKYILGNDMGCLGC